MYTPKKIKRALNDCIKYLSNNTELIAKKPEKDFSRQRKLPLSRLIKAMLSMTSKSIRGELTEFFNFSTDIPTASAYVQQRNKLRYEGIEYLFKAFTNSIDEQKLYKGYRLLAVDGTDLHTPTNPNEKESFYSGSNNQKPYNLIHLNALYDLQRKIYVDVITQGRRQENEHRALATMVDRDDSDVPTIYIADRGYESYNILAHIQEKGRKFLVRAKDFSYGGIVYALGLQFAEEMDEDVTLYLTKKQTNRAKQSGLKYLNQKCIFDFLPTKCNKTVDVQPYCLKFRVVRTRLADNSYEVFITNLDRNCFPVEELKALYAMRWGIETSFRALKYTLGTLYFRSKKTEYILQEIFANLTMYNFAQLITSHITIKQKRKKHPYQVNFSAAIQICRKFFLKNTSPSTVEALILQSLVPIRRGISNPRKMTGKKPIPSFQYRIS